VARGAPAGLRLPGGAAEPARGRGEGLEDPQQPIRSRLTTSFASLQAAAESSTRAALHAARNDPAPIDRIAAVTRDAGAMLERELLRANGESRQHAADHARVACTAGCTACCYIPLAVTAVEAIGAAAAVLRDQVLVGQVAERAPAIAAAPGLARWRQKLPCALLHNNLCKAYDARPLPCRAYVSFDADACNDAFRAGDADLQLGLPLRDLPHDLAGAIRNGIRAACVVEGVEDAHVELSHALAVIVRDSTAVRRWLAGERVFKSA
jgi:hypothetical protein